MSELPVSIWTLKLCGGVPTVTLAEYRPCTSWLARAAVTVPARLSRLRRRRAMERRCSCATWTSAFRTTFHCTVFAEARLRRERARRAEINRVMVAIVEVRGEEANECRGRGCFCVVGGRKKVDRRRVGDVRRLAVGGSGCCYR
jgi:hypothetical protein